MAAEALLTERGIELTRAAGATTSVARRITADRMIVSKTERIVVGPACNNENVENVVVYNYICTYLQNIKLVYLTTVVKSKP